MRRKTSQILIAFVVIMLITIAAYVRLWTIDYRISSDDASLLRQQFDLANREAMDESAEWRQRFDAEVEKNERCIKELDEVITLVRKSHKVMDVASIHKKLEMLEKENLNLLERIEILTRELEAEKFNCSKRHF